VILVGTCPGGTSSNVMTYLSKGDVALSVGMTSVSTILAPFLTPLLTKLYAGQTVDVNVVSMFISIIKVVIVPILLGFIINHFFKKFTEAAVEVLPLISTTAIVAIVAAVVSANSAKLMTCGLLIIGVVILHNVLGYLVGYAVGRVLKLDESNAVQSLSRLVCRTPVWLLHWQPYISHSIRWQPFRELYSVYGIMYPVRSLQTSMQELLRRKMHK